MTVYDPALVLAGLKDFQRETVEHAFHRLFEADDSTKRFLVADEVGLGKTLVAKGVIAKAIERLQHDGVKRIDIIYICSNGDIAAQNVRKLDVTDSGATTASRLTLLTKQLDELKERSLNVVALTPGTSFDQGSGAGKAEERHLLYWMLHDVWEFGDRAAPKNVLQASTRTAERFRADLRWFDRGTINKTIADQFSNALAARCTQEADSGTRTIKERFDDLCKVFGSSRKRVSPENNKERTRIIGELRGLLAAACVEALEPDLVILDEFQRFKHLLVDDPLADESKREAASLARALFTWQSPDTREHARVLMLSATPYRALTVTGDGGGDDHHGDFLATVRFLSDSEDRTDELRGLLRQYQRELYGIEPEASARLRAVGDQIEELLTRYVARTERIGAAGQHDAMLSQTVRTPGLKDSDIQQYLLAQSVADLLNQPDVMELWKSAPYLLNFLDGYKLRQQFDARCRTVEGERELAGAIAASDAKLLSSGSFGKYDEIDPGGPRLRELATDVIDSESWRLLWIPPSLPYHRLGGAYARPELEGFTKRLVFSSWRAVPRSVAGLLSYMAERRLVRETDADAVNTTKRRGAQRNRLGFTVDANGRRTGMPALGLVYPSPTLGAVGDPRDFALAHPDGGIDQLLDWVRARIQPLLTKLPEAEDHGDVDERWYWAAPLLLDAEDTQSSATWWSMPDLVAEWTSKDKRAGADGGRWADHVELAREAAAGVLDPPLGRKPEDLGDVLARLAVGAPGTIALRSIARTTKLDLKSVEARLAAAQVAWALRGLFNSPEATALLRAARTETFWREVLRHCVDGDLQAVLDEHAHILLESEGLQDKKPAAAASAIAEAMRAALGLRASGITYSSIKAKPRAKTIETTRERLHTAFAMRFGDEESGDRASSDEPARAAQLRDAFNSPYWPFVLVSTSVGQEGLDFHPYCHVVVHWNLPNNPVDLEQREGRVHRYKGHAVRKNVARKHGRGALADDKHDAWTTAFRLAAGDRLPTDSELVPYWIYPVEGGATVERHVLALPMSRELDRLEVLRNGLAVYRLAFGQARQEDVIDHLLRRLGPDRAKALAAELRIDLRPPLVAR